MKSTLRAAHRQLFISKQMRWKLLICFFFVNIVNLNKTKKVDQISSICYNVDVQFNGVYMTVKGRINILKTLNKDSEITVSVSEDELDGYVNHLKETLINDNNRADYPGSWIAMRWNYQDYEEFTLSQDGLQAIKTSDGHIYTFEHDGAEISHLWKNENDIMDWGSKPVRWVIYYYGEDNINDNNTVLDYKKQCNVIYVFGLDLNFVTHYWGSIFYKNDELLTFDFIDDFNVKSNDNDWSKFCYFCCSLQKLPDNLDTSSGTNFSNFCDSCCSLRKLPDNLDTSNGTDFGGFCYDCSSLQNLPDNLDTSKGTYFCSFCENCSSLQNLPDNLYTSKGTDFNSFCSGCSSLQELPDRLDTSKGTDFWSFCENCYSLQKLPDNLDTSNGLEFIRFCGNCYSLTQANIKLASQDYENLNDSGSLTVSSMRYMADNAPTVTDNKLTLGATNIARAKKYDPTIIETFTSKGWTVN